MTITPAQRATLAEAEQSESAALSLRKQAEAFEAEALALRASVYAEWDAVPPVVVPPIPPVVIPPIVVPPVDPPKPPVYDVLPAFKTRSRRSSLAHLALGRSMTSPASVSTCS